MPNPVKELDQGKFLLELYKKALLLSEKELYNYFLDQAVNLTRSEIGFFHFVSDDQKSIILTAWNEKALKNCTANYKTHYPIDLAGNWVDCVRVKHPVVYNNFSKSPNQKGIPPGHTTINRFMSIPVFENDKAMIVFGVGNKTDAYTKEDIIQLQLIANELSKIHKIRQAEQTIRESEKKYRTLFENMLDGFAFCRMIFDEKGKPVDFEYLEINDAFERMTGLKRETVVGKRVTVAIPGTEKANPELLEIYGRVSSTCEQEKFEIFFKPLGKWLSVSAYCPQKGYFAAVFEDITERKKAEESNRESEQRLRFHAENTPLAVVEWDKDFVVTRWAGEAEKMFGWTAAETIGKPLMDLHMVYEPDIPIVENTMRRLTGGETRVVSSNRNVTKDGRIIHCTWYNSVLLNDKRKMVSVFSFVEDTTARVNAEKALEQNNKNLEKLVEERTMQLKNSERLAAIGATAGMVGHDIRNPLQAITGDVFLAKSDLSNMPEAEEKESIRESLDEIQKNIDYINKIVQDLQDYARTLRPIAKEIDLEDLCKEVFSMNNIPRSIDASCKVAMGAKKIMTDPDILKRVLSNLVTNAVQAMPEGGKLSVNIYAEKEEVVLTIRDSGVGIPEEAREKLFLPLFTTKSKGQGFGLAVVKRMTEALGGQVSFESEVGRGTEFMIRLPVKP